MNYNFEKALSSWLKENDIRKYLRSKGQEKLADDYFKKKSGSANVVLPQSSWDEFQKRPESVIKTWVSWVGQVLWEWLAASSQDVNEMQKSEQQLWAQRLQLIKTINENKKSWKDTSRLEQSLKNTSWESNFSNIIPTANKTNLQLAGDLWQLALNTLTPWMIGKTALWRVALWGAGGGVSSWLQWLSEGKSLAEADKDIASWVAKGIIFSWALESVWKLIWASSKSKIFTSNLQPSTKEVSSWLYRSQLAKADADYYAREIKKQIIDKKSLSEIADSFGITAGKDIKTTTQLRDLLVNAKRSEAVQTAVWKAEPMVLKEFQDFDEKLFSVLDDNGSRYYTGTVKNLAQKWVNEVVNKGNELSALAKNKGTIWAIAKTELNNSWFIDDIAKDAYWVSFNALEWTKKKAIMDIINRYWRWTKDTASSIALKRELSRSISDTKWWNIVSWDIQQNASLMTKQALIEKLDDLINSKIKDPMFNELNNRMSIWLKVSWLANKRIAWWMNKKFWTNAFSNMFGKAFDSTIGNSALTTRLKWVARGISDRWTSIGLDKLQTLEQYSAQDLWRTDM